MTEQNNSINEVSSLTTPLISKQSGNTTSHNDKVMKNVKNSPRDKLVKWIWVAQALALLIFLVSAFPYFIDFEACIKNLYTTVDSLDVYKTISLRIHIIAGTINLALGPILVIHGIRRRARTSLHKNLGYVYTLAMVFNVLSSVPLIVFRFIAGGPWIAGPLVLLTAYSAVTIFLGIWAVAVRNDKPQHRRMLFRNYCGVFSFVTFRIGGVVGPGGFAGPSPAIFLVLTLASAEYIMRSLSTIFFDDEPGQEGKEQVNVAFPQRA